MISSQGEGGLRVNWWALQRKGWIAWRSWRSALLGSLILLVGCASATETTSSITQNRVSNPDDCTADSTEARPVMAPEAQARSEGGLEAWALFVVPFLMPNGEPINIPVDTEVKIVWRVSGTGDLLIHAMGPHGVSLDADWGPEPHSGSNWNRPGDEWGTGWTFPESGCWTFELSRGDLRSHLSFGVHQPVAESTRP